MNDYDSMVRSDLSQTILSCCFDIMNEIGSGFLETIYKNALYYTLLDKGLKVEAEMRFNVQYRGRNIGNYSADIVVENFVIVELKCCEILRPEHQAQLINYLKATGLPVGLLINFGNKKLEYKRLYHPDKSKQPILVV